MNKYLNKIYKKYPLLIWMFTAMILITIIGLAFILPITMCFTFKAMWPLLLYLPILGAGTGFYLYIDNN